MAYGMLSYAAIGFQNSFGTQNVDSYHYIPLISESITEKINPLVAEGMQNRFEEGTTYEGNHDIAGDIICEAHPILTGLFLAGWANNDTVTAINSYYYSHSIKPATDDFSTLAAVRPCTIEIYRDAGSAFLYYDMCIDAINFEFAYGALIK